MEAMINADEIVKSKIIRELRDFGCCDLCILRYLGNTDPHIYRLGRNQIQKLLSQDGSLDTGDKKNVNGSSPTEKDSVAEASPLPAPKVLKRSPCTACLGLLDDLNGTSETVLNEIALKVKEAKIETKSYTINLSLPISVQFRAYAIWYHLVHNFSSIYFCFPTMKPEGVCLKNVWKWIATSMLKEKIDPQSDWTTDGCLTVNVTLTYDDDDLECAPLLQFRKPEKGPKSLSRGGSDAILKDITPSQFKRKFGDSPALASKTLVVSEIHCAHVPLYIAGRYCKFSRNVSQTPWIIDGKRFHDGSVEELIAEYVLPVTKAEQEKFSASGREDVDTRMIGLGRPFVMEVQNPKRTLLTQSDMNNLRDQINSGTQLIRVRDLQLVDRKSSNKLKEGEESKTKTYCALCVLPDSEVTPEILNSLNSTPVPLVLQQKTPIRVLHRRALMTRERSIYSIKAIAGKSNNLIKLYVQTQAGTYVKEFVHGDLGRTKPCVADLLKCNVDIVALDVESVDFPWPPTIPD